MKINENKYNKLIKGEKYDEALSYLKEKGGANTDSYWFSEDAKQLPTFCFDPNFDDNKYNIILTYANNSFKDMNQKNRVYHEMAECYLVKANHYLWKGDYNKATQAYKESLEKLDNFKKENNLNPEDVKAIKYSIDNLYLNQVEKHELVQILRTLDVNALNLPEQEAYVAGQQIKGLLSDYDKPHKVHFITYQNYSTINKEFADSIVRAESYFKNDFFYNMSKKTKDKFFSGINLYSLFDDDYKTKEEEAQQAEQKKAALIKKYGKTFGESIFNKKVMIGMTKKMLEEGFNKPGSIDLSEYHEYWTWSDLMVTIDKETQKVTGITNLR